jgi:hypothetical protein
VLHKAHLGNLRAMPPLAEGVFRGQGLWTVLPVCVSN